jgi:gamma-tubulin complex component 3
MDKRALKSNVDLIQLLIKIYLPLEKINQYQTYFERIVSSKLSASVFEKTQVLQFISRRVSRNKYDKILNLVSKLDKSPYLTKKNEVFFLLFKLSDDKSDFMPGTPITNEKLPNSSPQPIITPQVQSKQKLNIEDSLIRDLLFAFQGIEGKFLNYSSLEDRFITRQDLPDCTRYILEQLSEIGYLYKKIKKFIVNNEEFASIVCQSFCGNLKTELKEYYRLIALLQNQSCAKLKHIDLWCDEPLERMRWLAIICEAVEGLKGGNFISAIFSYSKHGNPAIKVLVNRILDNVSVPILKMIESWMLDGELCDVYHEFFVEENLEVSEDQLWTHKYKLIKNLVPGFLPPELVDQIFLTGKSINFIRKCCFEEWKSEGPLELPKLRDLGSMKLWIESCSSVTNAKLIGILFDKYRFIEHTNCIRKYLLLAQGDFHHYLMDQLDEILNETARKVHKHNLVSILENSIRASNAQNDDLEFLNKLSIRLEDFSTMDNSWDVFVLKYQVDPPLNSIFSEQVMGQYTRIFKLFWRIKRVYYYMNSYQNKKELLNLGNMKGIKFILQKCQMLRLEIMHFINNLCHYLMVEVQEGAWNYFLKSIKNTQDLDKLITSQQLFLDTILERAFLTPENEKIYKRLLRLLELALGFRLSQETLINSVIDEMHRRKNLKSKDYSERGSLANLSRISNESVIDIERISLSFSDEIQIFRKLLSDGDKTHLRFLAFRLDFNEYYSIQNHKKENS